MRDGHKLEPKLKSALPQDSLSTKLEHMQFELCCLRIMQLPGGIRLNPDAPVLSRNDVSASQKSLSHFLVRWAHRSGAQYYWEVAQACHGAMCLHHFQVACYLNWFCLCSIFCWRVKFGFSSKGFQFMLLELNRPFPVCTHSEQAFPSLYPSVVAMLVCSERDRIPSNPKKFSGCNFWEPKLPSCIWQREFWL